MEHRYFLDSDPSGSDPNYNYFTALQESADLHDITTSLKKVLGGKWTSQAVDKWINLVPQKENSSTISTDSLYRYYYKYMFEKNIPDTPLDSYTLTYPYYIQAWLELGFFSDELYLSRFDPKYGLNPEKHGRDLKNELTKEDFAKIGSREFNSATMHNVVEFIKNTGGTKMVMVYGANDYWTGAGVKKEECDPQNVKYHLITRGTHTDNLDEFEIESEADAVWNDIMSFLQ